MEGGEGQVARLRNAERGRDRLEVPHLADQDDIRVFPQDRPQGIVVRKRVYEELALVDGRFFGDEEVLDRILDGHDVDAALVVDVVDHAGQRRRLAAARWAG